MKTYSTHGDMRNECKTLRDDLGDVCIEGVDCTCIQVAQGSIQLRAFF
jgi:hypothetical protein